MARPPLLCFIGNPDSVERVWGRGRRARLEAAARDNGFAVRPGVIEGTGQNALDSLDATELARIEVLVSTWGMPALDARDLDRLPSLRAVFYAAGSVQAFARPFLERGIVVMSAWAANAVPVAQWTVAAITLANKGFWRNEREYRAARGASFPGRALSHGPGNLGTSVAILGAGQIGSLVLEMLAPYGLELLVHDPFLKPERAEQLGARLVELEEAFARAHVVSNHVANLPATRGLLGADLFAAMPSGACFINTGRGATVREDELCRILEARPDLTALLDVTEPEPPQPQSPLWRLPNAVLTSHLAGSLGGEVARMADFAIEEFALFCQGRPLRYAVTQAMLETMA